MNMRYIQNWQIPSSALSGPPSALWLVLGIESIKGDRLLPWSPLFVQGPATKSPGSDSRAFCVRPLPQMNRYRLAITMRINDEEP